MLLQANLKADATTKPLLQRCQDLVKIIDEYPAKVQSALPPQCLVFATLFICCERLWTFYILFADTTEHWLYCETMR